MTPETVAVKTKIAQCWLELETPHHALEIVRWTVTLCMCMVPSLNVFFTYAAQLNPDARADAARAPALGQSLSRRRRAEPSRRVLHARTAVRHSSSFTFTLYRTCLAHKRRSVCMRNVAVSIRTLLKQPSRSQSSVSRKTRAPTLTTQAALLLDRARSRRSTLRLQHNSNHHHSLSHHNKSQSHRPTQRGCTCSCARMSTLHVAGTAVRVCASVSDGQPHSL